MREDEHIHYSDDDLFNPQTHHETSDVNVRALLWFLAIFVIISVIAHFVLLGFYRGMSRIEKARTGETLTMMQRPADAGVPKDEPLLQPFPGRMGEEGRSLAPYQDTPVTDLHQMRREEQRALESYGWVDERKGVVRIPIDVAKRLVVERGLPVQQTTTAPATTTGGQP